MIYVDFRLLAQIENDMIYDKFYEWFLVRHVNDIRIDGLMEWMVVDVVDYLVVGIVCVSGM